MMSGKLFCGLFVVCALLVAVGSAQKSSTGKNEVLLAEKFQKMTALTRKNPTLRVTNDRYREYLKKAPRNYSVIVMLTTLSPRRQCSFCIQAYEEFEIVASSWKYSKPDPNNLFFAMADFDDAPDIFRDLQVQSVPEMVHIPASGKSKKKTRMIEKKVTAKSIASFVAETTGIQMKIYRPINYQYWGSMIGSLAVICVAMFKLRSKLHLLHFLLNKYCLAILILISIFGCISGFMWNQIRSAPMTSRDPRTGVTTYIHPNRRGQFIAETYIVMCIYGSMMVGFIMMNEVTSLKLRWTKTLLALAGLCCFTGFFVLLLSTFKRKTPSYPNSIRDLLNAA